MICGEDKAMEYVTLTDLGEPDSPKGMWDCLGKSMV